jgi:hypothetical protein
VVLLKVVQAHQIKEQIDTICYYNFMTTASQLNKHLTVILYYVSGYTTIMDLAKLCKKAFFIPTPGQYRTNVFSTKLKKRQLPYIDQETVLLLKIWK